MANVLPRVQAEKHLPGILSPSTPLPVSLHRRAGALGTGFTEFFVAIVFARGG
ncbi:MAG TPA: hypothetical protein VFQ00_05395 [Terriglobales bacterium]|nr:hypothetical protein [Terriglobales bacterium]